MPPKFCFSEIPSHGGLPQNQITNSFVDIVERNGFITYNKGIGGTDPAQYAFLAEKYIPVLKTDIVAVMFYMGNDLLEVCRPMIAYKNLHYVTNAGWILGYNEDYSRYFDTAHEAYSYYVLGERNLKARNREHILQVRHRDAFMECSSVCIWGNTECAQKDVDA
jgi:hypothetical protein